MRGPLAVVATCYVSARVLIAGAQPVYIHNDSFSYQTGVSLLGRSSRPWVLPLLCSLLDDRGVVAVQTIVSALAFVVFAVAIGVTIGDGRVRLAFMALVLLVGVSDRVTMWDTAILSESLAGSLSLLLIAALVHLRRPAVAAAIVPVFVFWLFTRDLHLYVGVLVLLGVIAWVLRHDDHRPWLVGTMIGAMLWAGFAYGNDQTVETYNVTSNVASRVLIEPEHLQWFLDHGMPANDVFAQPMNFMDRHAALADDPEYARWVNQQGSSTYALFLIEHPGYAWQAFDNMLPHHRWVHSVVDGAPLTSYDGVDIGIVWPREASWYTLLLVSSATILSLVLVLVRGALDRRWIVPVGVLVAALPAFFLAYHATPLEVARHGSITALTVVLAGWWIVALVADSIVEQRRRQRSSSEGNAVHEANARASELVLTRSPAFAGRLPNWGFRSPRGTISWLVASRVGGQRKGSPNSA